MAEGRALARKAIDAAGRAAGDYRANRDDLEPVIRLVIDAVALTALILRPRAARPATKCTEGQCS